MGKIFKRVISLLLGAILGIASVVTTLATSVYYMYTDLPVGSLVLPEKEDELGDLSDASIEDILAILNNGAASPENYTIGDLKEKYGFDLIGLINGFSNEPIIKEDDKQFIADLESVSIFTLFTEGGLSRFLADLPVGALLGFIPEDLILSKAEREKLRSYSVGQFIAKDEATGRYGFLDALSDVKLGGVLPSVFEDGDGDGNYSAKDGMPDFLDLVANVEFGGIIDVVTKKSTIGDEIVNGGLSSIGNKSVGEILTPILGEGNTLVETLDNLFNNVKVSDLFEKDVVSGEYVFVADKLLDNVKLGALLGYKKGDDGVWLDKDGKPAKGLMEELVSLDLTTLFHVFTGEGELTDKIHNALLVMGDLTVGDVFESFLGFEKSENGEWVKDGKPVNKLLTAICDISIEDIVGEEGTELSLDNVRKNLVNSIQDSCGDLTIGEGLGELFGIEKDENGNYVYSNNGKEINVLFASLLDVKFSDLVDGLGGDKVDLSKVLKTLENALAGTTLGKVLGAEKVGDVWYDANGKEVDKFVSLVYDVEFSALFALIDQLSSGNFSYGAVIEALLPELRVGDIAKALVKDLTSDTGEEGADETYFLKGEKVQEGLNTLLNLKLWQIPAGLDKNHAFDLKAVIKDIPLGEVVNYEKSGNEWIAYGKIKVTGAAAELFDFTLGDLLSDEEGTTKDKLEEVSKRVTLGEFFTIAFVYDAETKTSSLIKGEDLNEFIVALCTWDYSIGDLLDVINGKQKVNAEYFRKELNDLIGDIALGESVRGLLTKFADSSKQELTLSVLPQLKGFLDPIMNTDCKVFIDLVFDIVAGKTLDVVELLEDIYGDDSIADIVGPLLNLGGDENGYKLGDKELGVAITALLNTEVVSTIEVFLKGKGDAIAKINSLVNGNPAIVDLDYMLGDYLTMFTGYEYDDENANWLDKKKEKLYEPINKLLKVNVLDVLNNLLLDKEKTLDDKIHYLIDLFEGLTVRDVLSIIPAFANSEKSLLKKIGDLRIDLILHDFLNKENKPLDVVDKHLGAIQVYDFVTLFLTLTPATNSEGWPVYALNGKGVPLVLCDLMDVSVSNVLSWFKADDKLSAIITELVGKRNFGNHFADFGLKVFDRDSFKTLHDKNVAEFINELLKTKNFLEFIKPYVNDIYLGDVLSFFLPIEGKECAWIYNGKPAKQSLNTLFDIQVGDVLSWIKNPKAKEIVNELFKERTFGDYFSDFGEVKAVNDVLSKNLFNCVRDVKVAEFIGYFIDKDLEKVKEIFGEIYVGEVLEVATIASGSENAWKLLKLENKDYVNTVLNIQVKEVLGWTKKGVTAKSIVADIFEKRTFDAYFDDFDDVKVAKSILDESIFDFVRNEEVATVIGYIIDKKWETLLDIVGEVSVGHVLDLVNLATDDNGSWKVGKLEDKDYIETLLNVTVNDVRSWIKEKKVKNAVADIFEERTFEDYFNDFYDITVAKNVLSEQVFNCLRAVKVADFICYFIDKDWESLKGIVGDVSVGQVLDLVNLATGEQDNWKVAKLENKDYVNTVLNIQVKEVLGWTKKGVTAKSIVADIFEKRTFDAYFDDFDDVEVAKKVLDESIFDCVRDVEVVTVIGYIIDKDVESLKALVGEVSVGQVLDLVNLATGEQDNWKVAKLENKDYVNTVLNIQVKEIFAWTKKGVTAKSIVADIFEKRTFEDYFDDFYDITVAKKVLEQEIFYCVRDDQVATVIGYVIDKDVESLKLIVGSIYVAYVVDLVKAVEGEKGNWKFASETETLDAVVCDVFDIQLVDVFRWTKGGKVDAKAIVKEVFGERAVIDFVDLFGGISGKDTHKATKSSGSVVWALNTMAFPLIVSDVLDVTVVEILDLVDLIKDTNALIEKATDVVFDDRQIEEYTKDLGITLISDNDAFRKLREEYAEAFVNGLVKAKDKVEFILSYFDEAKIGNFVQIGLTKLTENEEERIWYNNGTAMWFILGDVFSVTVGDVRKWIKNISDVKPTVSDIVNTVAQERTVLEYVENVVGKDVKNDGFDKLLSLEVAQIVDVMLGLEGIEKDNVTKIVQVDYILNHTDEIMIGEFFKGYEGGYTYDESAKKWSKNGKEEGKFMQAVLSAPSSYVIYAVAVIVKPELIVDAFGDKRVGSFIQEPYNNIKALDSTIEGNNEDGYTVVGAYKEIMEKVANATVREIYESLMVNKTALKDLEEIFLNRELGDYLFDTLVQFVYKKDSLNVSVEGYASDKTDENGKYSLDANAKKLLDKVLNLNIKDTKDALTKNAMGFVEEFISDVYVGDLVYDLYRKFVEKTIPLGAEGFAFENAKANGGFYATSKNFKKVADITLNIRIKAIYDAIKDGKLEKELRNYYWNVRVGDIAYDLLRKFVEKTVPMGIEGYAYEKTDVNTGAYALVGNFANVMTPTLNVRVFDVYDAIKNKQVESFVLDVYKDVVLGDVAYDLLRKFVEKTVPLGVEGYGYDNKLANGKYVTNRNFANVVSTTLNVNAVDLYKAIKDKKILEFVEETYTDVLVGDLVYDLLRKFVEKTVPLGAEGYAFENRANNDGKFVTDRNFAEIVSTTLNVRVFDIVNALKDKKALEFVEDVYGNIVVGDLVYDLYRKFVEKIVPLGVEGYAFENAKANGGFYATSKNFKRIADITFNLNVLDIVNAVKAKSIEQYVRDNYWSVRVGDIAYDLLRKFVEKTVPMGIAGYAYENRSENSGLYNTSGNFKDVVDTTLNLNVIDLVDAIKGKTVESFVLAKYEDILVGDVAYDLLRKYVEKKVPLGVEGYGYANKQANGGKYATNRNFANVVSTTLNVNVVDLYKAIKDKQVESFVLDVYKDVLLGDVAYDLIRKYVEKKVPLGVEGYAFENRANNGGKYVTDRNFANVVSATLNVNAVDLYKAIKDNKALDFVKETYKDILVGDLAYDLLRKYVEKNIAMGIEGYSHEHKLANGGKFVTSKNFKTVANKTLNLNVVDLVNYTLDNQLNMIIYDIYNNVTFGDLGYDLFKSFVAKHVPYVEATGYAWEYAENDKLLSGKLAKPFRAVFAITLADVWEVVKGRTTIKDFVIEELGAITVADTVVPFIDKVLVNALEMTIDYDVALDYRVYVRGNFAEIANAVFAISVEDLLTMANLGDLLIGDNGLITDMPVGHIVGYLPNLKGLEKVFKHTEIEHVYGGSWKISGAFEVPMNILCSELTFRDVYDARTDIKEELLLKHFGDVMVGHFMGGNTADGKWYTSNGTEVDTHGAKNVIMNALYDMTVEQILGKDFDVTSVIEDIYAGQLMGYYYCGEFKYSKDAESDYPTCEDETHVDVDGYHYHFECEIKNEGHTHDKLGEGWYVIDAGVYTKVGAVEQAVAHLTLKTLMGGRLNMANVLEGVTLGEAMNLVYCDQTSDCEILANLKAGETHTCKEGWYKIETVNGVITYTREGVLMQKVSDVNMKVLLTDGIDLEDTFRGTYIGDVLGYSRCYVDGEGNRVCAEELGHVVDHDHKGTNVWYEYDETLGKYVKVPAIEGAMANVAMSEIVRGTFDADDALGNLTIGAIMGYEKCTGDYNCFVHDNCNSSTEGKWYNNGVEVTDNLAKAIVDFSINDMKDDGFIGDVLENIKATVTLADIFADENGNIPAGTPITLISANTPVGQINEALKTALQIEPAGKLYEAGILNISDETEKELDKVFGTLAIVSAKNNYAGDLESYKNQIRAALIAAQINPDALPPKYTETQINTVGGNFWRSLKPNELIDVLLASIELPTL